MLTRKSFVGAAAAAAVSASFGTAAFADEPAQANRVCEVLGIQKPVIQAFMAQLTSPELCAAVANAGGLGILGMPSQEDIQATKALTDQPFCAAYYGYDEDTIQMLKDEGVNIVFFLNHASVDNDYFVDVDGIKALKDEGFTVIFRDVSPTVEAMVKAQDAGADVIIASGYGQGGHMTETRITLASMLAEAKPQITVPLVAGGCIVDRATAAAAAALGAEAAYVGTRFNASVESPCSDAAKQAILDARAEDLVEWRGIEGFVRATDSDISQQAIALSNEGASRSDISDVYQMMWGHMRSGDLEGWPVGMNDAVNSITELMTAQEIVDMIAPAFA